MQRNLALSEPARRGRPPRDQNLPGSPRAQLVRIGMAIVTEKGFSAVGINEILSVAGMPKGSFYHYFDSKDAFGLALVDAYAGYFARKLDYWFGRPGRTPLHRFGDFIDDARAGMARHGFRRGCLVGNLGQEMGTLSEPFRARLSTVFKDWEARTAKCLEEARTAGEVRADADCGHLARIFWIGWEGAVLRAKLDRGPAALDQFAEGFFALIRA